MRLRYSDQLIRHLDAFSLYPLARRAQLYEFTAANGKEALLHQLDLICARLQPSDFLVRLIEHLEQRINSGAYDAPPQLQQLISSASADALSALSAHTS